MYQKQDEIWLEEVCKKIKQKITWVSEKSKNKIPYTTVEGIHDDRSDSSLIQIMVFTGGPTDSGLASCG